MPLRPTLSEMERLVMSYLAARPSRSDRSIWTRKEEAAWWHDSYLRANHVRYHSSLARILERFTKLGWLAWAGERFQLTTKGSERYAFAKAFESHY